MYNLHSFIHTDVLEVPLVGAEQVAEKRFFSLRGFVVCLAILTLTISLASRGICGGFYSKTTAHSASASAKVQHRDKDASEFVPPAPTLSLLCVTEPSKAPAQTEAIYVQLHYNSLYNRPPPLG
jgi:hypothetical protein